MIIKTLKALFQKDLAKLKEEIGLYRDETVIWKTEGDITNSAGNLCLHLIGNLKAFIGAELGQSGYVRDRDLEFSATGVSRGELLKRIDETAVVVDSSLDKVTPEHLKEDYPLIVLEKQLTTGFFLIHLGAHLNYHLGQINYHRRIFDAPAE